MLLLLQLPASAPTLKETVSRESTFVVMQAPTI